jgi:acyl carrier protein
MNVDPAVLAEVQSIVAEVLACEPEEATPRARFFNDLGGESIDFLDLTFRCEKRFHVKLGMEKMLDAEYAATDEAGVLTPQSLAKLQERFAFLDFSQLPEQATKAQLADLLTVEAIAQFVSQASVRHEAQPASHPS